MLPMWQSPSVHAPRNSVRSPKFTVRFDVAFQSSCAKIAELFWEHGLMGIATLAISSRRLPIASTTFGVAVTGSAATFKNSVSTGWGPRVGFAWDVLGRHNTATGGLRHLLRAGTWDYCRPVELQSPFCPDRVLWTNTGLHRCRTSLLVRQHQSEWRAGRRNTVCGVVALPGAVDEFPRYEWSSILRGMLRTGR